MLSGQGVDLLRGFAMRARPGKLRIDGQDVALLAGRSIVIDTGLYVLSGQDVAFTRDFGTGTPRTVYLARLTTSAPHFAAITTSQPHKVRVPRSNYQ